MKNVPLTVVSVLLMGVSPVVGAAHATSSPSPITSTTAAPASETAHDLSLGPYREIGRVRAMTTFCSTIVDHAVKAVDLGVDNDGKLDIVVHTLRTADFDANMLSKNAALQRLSNQYAVLAEQSIAAERAAKALRVDAQTAPSPEEKQNLVAFADALDGALHRQRTVARDLASMIAIFNVRPQITPMEHDEMVVDEQASENYRGSVTYDSPQSRVPPLLSTVAKAAADQIVVRQTGIVHDEHAAAQLIAPTFGGC